MREKVLGVVGHEVLLVRRARSTADSPESASGLQASGSEAQEDRSSQTTTVRRWAKRCVRSRDRDRPVRALESYWPGGARRAAFSWAGSAPALQRGSRSKLECRTRTSKIETRKLLLHPSGEATSLADVSHLAVCARLSRASRNQGGGSGWHARSGRATFATGSGVFGRMSRRRNPLVGARTPH